MTHQARYFTSGLSGLDPDRKMQNNPAVHTKMIKLGRDWRLNLPYAKAAIATILHTGTAFSPPSARLQAGLDGSTIHKTS